MTVLEKGNTTKPIVILIHGFESYLSIFNPYIEYFKDKYHFLIPLLPGHDKTNPLYQFTTMKDAVDDFISYLDKYKDCEIRCIYAMSMGGVFATELWKRNLFKINHMILESSPLHYFSKTFTSLMEKQYLKINEKTRKRDEKTLKNAIKTITPPDLLEDLCDVIDTITDESVSSYLSEISSFSLPTSKYVSSSLNMKDTKLTYFYGGKLCELPFRRIAKYLEKNYENVETICIKGKGHCELSILHPSLFIPTLEKYL